MSNVRSAPSPSNKPPKSTAIVRGETVEEVARHTIRWTSLGVLALSFAGAIVAFNGSWPAFPQFWRGLSPLAVILGIGVQLLCTVLEWAFRRRRFDPRYFVPLAFDVASTYIGYAPLLGPILALAVERAGLPGTLGYIAVGLLSILAAYWPEQTLVEG